MSLLEAVRLALLQIRVQKLKSALTILGVTIGVTFLIGIVSVVQGMGNYMQHDVIGKLMTVNGFEIHRWPTMQLGGADEQTLAAYHRHPPLYEHDTAAIFAGLPAGVLYALENNAPLTVSAQERKPQQILIHSVTPSYFTIKNLQMMNGRAFTEQEDAAHTPVAIIGKDVKDRFFPSVDPIGHAIRIHGLPYRVIGVTEPQGSLLGMSMDRFVIIPYHSPVGRLTANGRDQLDGIVVQSPSPTAQIAAEEGARQALRSLHELHPDQPDDFAIETPTLALDFWRKIQRYLVLAGIILPAIGLVVGAIVIMNIMLVAVAERTREIGIRKSLGAKRSDIVRQFLIESATLSTTGALAGIAFGIALSWLVRAVTPLPTSVALWSVLTSIALGIGVGIAAGVYPANRASRLDPILALHAE